MPESLLYLIKQYAQFVPKEKLGQFPRKRRGLYVLYIHRKGNGAAKGWYDVVYVGMTCASLRRRIQVHRRTKGKYWTHFSMYEVWDNIRDEQIKELEGLFRHIYRYDSIASKLTRQRSFKRLSKLKRNKPS